MIEREALQLLGEREAELCERFIAALDKRFAGLASADESFATIDMPEIRIPAPSKADAELAIWIFNNITETAFVMRKLLAVGKSNSTTLEQAIRDLRDCARDMREERHKLLRSRGLIG